MFLDTKLPESREAIELESQASDNKTTAKQYPARLSDEEQSYIWALLLQNRFVGRVWPLYAWDEDDPLYELLVDRDLAVAELNAVSDLPITAQQLRTIVIRFGGKGTLKGRLDEFYAKRRDRRIGG